VQALVPLVRAQSMSRFSSAVTKCRLGDVSKPGADDGHNYNLVIVHLSISESQSRGMII